MKEDAGLKTYIDKILKKQIILLENKKSDRELISKMPYGRLFITVCLF
ncbi:MAG: hypothetical protein ABIK92_02695 [Pseudomonadota bacterium]